MAIIFKHRYKSDSLIGTGTYKFRPYTIASPLPQLATPQNVSADGTMVSWDEVENATSYAVLADGVSIGTVEKGAAIIGETWLLNDIVDGRTLQTTKVDFTSNNTSYSYIVTKKGYIAYSNSEEWNDTNMVYDTASWTNSVYRTITFETAPTGDLLTWLQANATKQ